jgi:hypothetical protein
MKSQLPAMTKTILMASRVKCLAGHKSAVVLRRILSLRSVRIEIEHLGLNQQCRRAGGGQDPIAINKLGLLRHETSTMI